VFNKILIANRSEIACRVIKTAKRLGVQTVAVYSDADTNSLHTKIADEAIHIGASEAAKSYLSIEAILRAAKSTGADAIHPGYGFLSENADFADAVTDAGLVFIGPPASAMRKMGSKDEAKKRMIRAKVPVIPGYHGHDQTVETLKAEARKTGFPVLLKAAAGGGGKGMRIVHNPAEMDAAIEGAKREGQASFGSSVLLIEKYFERARHVEVQVFCDSQGHAVHLFERDCSLQRRHQKVIEEAPAPNLSSELRQQMGDAAVRAANAVNYLGAGTIEFLLGEDQQFYFLEMNTRLQVEHPVTEMITGLDLVEWQLLVADGQPLPLGQEQISCHGHAMEARIYAEDPANDFLPSPGTLHYLEFPKAREDRRIETGIQSFDEVSPFYDPMIAKIVVHGDTRDIALKKLTQALMATKIAGLVTNVDYLKMLSRHDRFKKFDINTGFIDQMPSWTAEINTDLKINALIAATISIIETRTEKYNNLATKSSDPYSPWAGHLGWRILGDSHQNIKLHDQELDIQITIKTKNNSVVIEGAGDEPISITRYKKIKDEIFISLNGCSIKAQVHTTNNLIAVFILGETFNFTNIDDALVAKEKSHSETGLTAPMPGKVVDVWVKSGTHVKTGDILLVIEAMKMEHSIIAQSDGIVEDVFFTTGDQVTDGVELLQFKSHEDG